MDTPETNRLFSCKAEIVCGEKEMSADIKRLGNGMWNADISAPDELSGIALEYSEEGIEASYMGLGFTLEKTGIPSANILSMVFGALDDSAILTEMPCVQTEEERVFSGEYSSFSYEITTDLDGNLTGFSIPDEDINVEFTDFSVIT